MLTQDFIKYITRQQIFIRAISKISILPPAPQKASRYCILILKYLKNTVNAFKNVVEAAAFLLITLLKSSVLSVIWALKDIWGLRPKFIKKETLAQVFSCEFYEISKNTFSYRTPLVAASVVSKLAQTFIWAFQPFTISFQECKSFGKFKGTLMQVWKFAKIFVVKIMYRRYHIVTPQDMYARDM